MLKNLLTNKLRKAFAGLLFCGVLFTGNVYAQDSESGSIKDKFSLNVTLNSDIFFGFYPFFAGSYSASDKIDLTFYGIQWSGGVAEAWGNWTEFGIGVGLPIGEAIYVNPQIGLLNGSLTSGLGTPVLGEGIVPNLTTTWSTDKIQGEFYAGYYYGFEHGAPNTNNYLHYWLNTGYYIADFLSIGGHFEHLRYTGGQNVDSDAAVDLYMSFGPYVQFSDPDGSAFVRFATGGDLRSDDERLKSGNNLSSFFKLTVGYGF